MHAGHVRACVTVTKIVAFPLFFFIRNERQTHDLCE